MLSQLHPCKIPLSPFFIEIIVIYSEELRKQHGEQHKLLRKRKGSALIVSTEEVTPGREKKQRATHTKRVNVCGDEEDNIQQALTEMQEESEGNDLRDMAIAFGHVQAETDKGREKGHEMNIEQQWTGEHVDEIGESDLNIQSNTACEGQKTEEMASPAPPTPTQPQLPAITKSNNRQEGEDEIKMQKLEAEEKSIANQEALIRHDRASHIKFLKMKTIGIHYFSNYSGKVRDS